MEYESIYLAHHGIPGMKWGVRRYQNYDGSYTQKGLKRYQSAEANATTQYNKLKKAKSDYKSGTGSKEQVKQAKSDYATARSRQIRNYRQLKQDKLADQGKKLYAKGHTINGNYTARAAVTAVGSLAGVAAGLLMTGKSATVKLGNRTWNTDTRTLTMASIYAGTAAVTGIMSAKSAHENRRLRAYYGHSTPKD